MAREELHGLVVLVMRLFRGAAQQTGVALFVQVRTADELDAQRVRAARVEEVGGELRGCVTTVHLVGLVHTRRCVRCVVRAHPSVGERGRCIVSVRAFGVQQHRDVVREGRAHHVVGEDGVVAQSAPF